MEKTAIAGWPMAIFLVKLVPGNKLGSRWPSDHRGNNHQNGRPHSHGEALPEGKLNKSGRHAFKVTTGLPPHRWLISQRVERAQEILINSTLSLVEVAELTGFADQSHFTRVFTSTVGISPGEWRRQRP